MTNSATLTVNTVISATALTSLTNCPGTSASFSTVASGTGSLGYQWYRRMATAWRGETGSSCTANDSERRMRGTYTVEVAGLRQCDQQRHA